MALARRPLRAAPEQDAEQWYAAALGCLEELRGIPVAALGVGGEGPSLVVADELLRPVAPALTWMDSRAAEQAERLARATGRPVRPASLAARAMWLRERAPGTLERARWLFSSWDYLASRLVGRAVSFFPTDPELMAASGVTPSLLPPYLEPPAVAGQRDGRAVVGCFVDSFNGILGSGVREVGQGCLNAGSLGTVTVMCRPEVATIRVADRPAASRLLSATGSSLEWIRSLLAPDLTVEHLLADAAGSPPGARGARWYPYLSGGRAPLAPPEARGALTGLRLDHDRADVVRATLEGAAFAFRLAVDDLRASGVEVSELRICGGQARSRLWNEIKASVLGTELQLPRVLDAALLGAALLAGVASGVVSDVDEGVRRMTHVAGTVQPRWDYEQAYREWADRHRVMA